MARKDSEHQKKSMSLMFRGKEIFKPLNTGRIDDLEFVFRHRTELCAPFKKRMYDPRRSL